MTTFHPGAEEGKNRDVTPEADETPEAATREANLPIPLLPLNIHSE